MQQTEQFSNWGPIQAFVDACMHLMMFCCAQGSSLLCVLTSCMRARLLEGLDECCTCTALHLMLLCACHTSAATPHADDGGPIDPSPHTYAHTQPHTAGRRRT